MLSLDPYLLSGVLAGLAGLLTFLTIHHFWIQPIWFIMPVGFLLSSAGGLAVGWAYKLILQSLAPFPWTFLELSLVIFLILLPSMLLAQRSPVPIGLDGALMPGFSAGKAAAQFIRELVLTSVLVGAVFGWLLGRSNQAVLATALAGLIFALGPGHNIPFLGNTPSVGKGVVLLLVIITVSSFTLMICVRWLGAIE